MDRTDRMLCVLLRAGLADEATGGAGRSDLALRPQQGPFDWPAVYAQASAQGVLAVAWDGLLYLIIHSHFILLLH